MHLPPDVVPYPWQRAVAERLRTDHRLAVEAAPGAGKTLAAMVAVDLLKPRATLIVAPAGRVCQQWQRVCSECGMAPTIVGLPGCKDIEGELASALLVGCAIIPWSRLQRVKDAGDILAALACQDGPVGLLVIDESQYAQGAEECVRGNYALGWVDKRKKTSFCGLRHFAERILALSGTPTTSDPKKIRAQLLFAGVDREHPTLANKYTYEAQYWGGRREYSYAAKRELWVTDDEPTSNHRELVKKGIVRVSAADLASQLPGHRRVLRTDWTEGAPAPQALLDWADAGGSSPGALPMLEDLADMRREATRDRTPAIVAEVVAWHEEAPEGQMLLVWACYQESAEELFIAIEKGVDDSENRIRDPSVDACAYLHGGLSDKVRASILKNACDGSVRVLVATHASTGVGVDGLQHVCCRALMAEAPWTPGECEQTEGRLYRTGQSLPVISEWVASGIEGLILRGVGLKSAAIAHVMSAADVLAMAAPPEEKTNDWDNWLEDLR